MRRSNQPWWVFRQLAVWSCLAAGGCTFGPKALERSHAPYNEAVKQVAEQQLLLNIVRLRYNENPMRLDVSAIAAQYELNAAAEAGRRPVADVHGITLFAVFRSALVLVV
jgi:hypothetical protein